MTGHAAIVDTNVVVAGLLPGSETSPVARILDGMLAASFPFPLSEELLAEYRAVLVRPGSRRQHGLTVAQIEAILIQIAQNAIIIEPVAGSRAPDPGEQMIGNVLEACASAILITGDKLLLQAGMSGRVIAPQAFVARL